MKWTDTCLNGLKFGTDDFDFCLDVTWNTESPNEGSWTDTDVPDGQVICGLAANTDTLESSNIPSLGFLMATEENQ